MAAVWQHPNAHGSNIYAFICWVNRAYSLKIDTPEELHTWSVGNTRDFAWACWKFLGVLSSRSPDDAFDGHFKDGMLQMWPPPKWFPGARMNYTENILKPGLHSRPEATAVTYVTENLQKVQHWTFSELAKEVSIWAVRLKILGLGSGDSIAVVLPNSVECLTIFLAAASMGAVFSSSSPDTGTTAIVNRYRQLQPKVLVLQTETFYNGKMVNLKAKCQRVHNQLTELCPDSISTIVLGPTVVSGRNVYTPDQLDVLGTHTSTSISYAQLPFDHPLYVLYSSGTTGPPKCICHSAGGALLQQKKELVLHQDLGINSTLYQYTTTGWMMWNWMIIALSVGARIVLYNGSPLKPTPQSQLSIISRFGVTDWGTSPKFLSVLLGSGLTAQDAATLSTLRAVHSVGAPLTLDIISKFYNVFPPAVGLFNGSGGTDLVSAILTGSPMAKLCEAEIPGPALGMDVRVWDADGNDVTETGREGDLIITKPFFSMPIRFLGVDGHAKYYEAYFAQFPGVWCHGDFLRKNPQTGGFQVLGRSDGVLNPAGVRFGAAELYAVLGTFAEVVDSIAVGRRTESAEEVLLFVRLATGVGEEGHSSTTASLSDSLIKRIAQAIREMLSARHVPAHIYQVSDIPYTQNGKRMENMVRDIVNGKWPTKAALQATANPECLRQYKKFVLSSDREKQAKL